MFYLSRLVGCYQSCLFRLSGGKIKGVCRGPTFQPPRGPQTFNPAPQDTAFDGPFALLKRENNRVRFPSVGKPNSNTGPWTLVRKTNTNGTGGRASPVSEAVSRCRSTATRTRVPGRAARADRRAGRGLGGGGRRKPILRIASAMKVKGKKKKEKKPAALTFPSRTPHGPRARERYVISPPGCRAVWHWVDDLLECRSPVGKNPAVARRA